MTISVVVPCFNARRWIGPTLRSVLSQDLAPEEVIVVDDGSTDQTDELIARDFPGVRVIKQSNAGVAAARNRGVKEAASEWVAFVDADDIWLPSKLRRQHDAVRALPQTRLCYTAWEVWSSDEPEPDTELIAKLSREDRAVPGPSGWIYCELLEDCHVWTSTTMMRRDLFLELGGFDESLRIGEDYDLWLRASRVTPIVQVDRPLALYRSHLASLTRRKPDRNWQALVVTRAIERWGLIGPEGRLANSRAVYGALARSWRGHAVAHLHAGQARLAMLACMQALRLRWYDTSAWKLIVRCLWTGAPGRGSEAGT